MAQVAMRPGRNGHGQLRVGGKPGNKGGGNTPKVLRLRSREVFEQWLAWAEREMKKRGTQADLRMQIGNTAAKYGLGTTITETDADGNTPAPRQVMEWGGQAVEF